MSRPTVEIPREHWSDYFEEISREAALSPAVVESLDRRRAEAILPLPLRHLGYDRSSDEITVAVEGEAPHDDDLFPQRLHHPVAVWADAPEPFCPNVLIVCLAQDPSPVAILLKCTAPVGASSGAAPELAE